MFIINILLKYIMVSMSLFIIFGLIVLNENSKWYECIIAMLFMPFILIAGFGVGIIEDIKNKKTK